MTTVLVVEDDVMFAKAVGHDLADQGFQVSIVHTVEDALARVTELPFDVLLTDLRLGAQDGIDLLSALREVSPNTRSVLMSGYATARDYHRAVELGAIRVLCKPFTPAELIQCVRQAVECGNGFRGSVHGLSLVDMLQMYNFGRRSVTIAVAGRSPGRLHLRDGQIIHAEHQGLNGEAAVRSILAMPAGTLSTAALPASIALTVTRDFREVLLEALQAIDEATPAREVQDSCDIEFDVHDSLLPPPNVSAPVPIEPTSHSRMLARAREIEGYVASCLVLWSNGGVVCFDGSIDLRPAAVITAEVMRRKQKTIEDMGIDDEAEDLLITSTNQYHLLRDLHSEVPAFIYIVLDRTRSNPMLAKLALSNAVRSL